MKRKYFLGIIIAFILVVQGALYVYGDSQIYQLRRIQAYMPEVTVEINNAVPQDISSNAKAYIGNQALQFISAVPADAEQTSSHIFILIDISGSVRKSFDAVKAAATEYVRLCSPNDHFTLVLFGETVQTLIEESSNKDEVIAAINGLSPTDNYTLLYEGLNTVFERSIAKYSNYNRIYGIVFSDGADIQKGNITFQEISNRLSQHAFPVYAVYPEWASKESIDQFGILARTSGGEIMPLDEANAAQSAANLRQEIQNVTILQYQADSNLSLGTEEVFHLEISGQQLNQLVNASKSLEDNTAPEIKDVVYNDESQSIRISFTENVQNADNISSYLVTDKTGKEYQTERVEYQKENHTAKLYVKEKLIGTEFKLSFTGITDQSMQKNVLKNKEIQFAGAEDIIKDTGKNQRVVSSTAWIIIAMLFIVIAAAIIIIVFAVNNRKWKMEAASSNDEKPNGTNEKDSHEQKVNMIESQNSEQYHIKKPAGKKLSLFINLQNTGIRKLDMEISSSIIIGRSNVCDVFIDDKKMSRQHVCIELISDDFIVSNLSTTNGTRLNHIPLQSKQKLLNGDSLLAGNTEIIVRF